VFQLVKKVLLPSIKFVSLVILNVQLVLVLLIKNVLNALFIQANNIIFCLMLEPIPLFVPLLVMEQTNTQTQFPKNAKFVTQLV
jgi:hypothetical protein